MDNRQSLQPDRSADEPRVVLFGLSDVGKQRENQEDAWLVYEPATGPERRRIGRIFAVADGIGGSRCGEVASRLAIEAVLEACLQATGTARHRLRWAIQEANRRVVEASEECAGCRGMGSAIVAAIIQANRLTVAWMGDSRAYLLRDRSITAMTRDHQSSPGRLSGKGAGLSRWVGMGGSVDPDVREIMLHQGDRVLLCTDGLHGLVAEDEMLRAGGGSVERWSRDLVQLALKRGAPDNVTVVCAHVDQLPSDPHRRPDLSAGATLDGMQLEGLLGEDQFHLWFRARAGAERRLLRILRPELQSDTEFLLDTQDDEEWLARVQNSHMAIVERPDVEKSMAYICLAPPWPRDQDGPGSADRGELHSLYDALSHLGSAKGMGDPAAALQIAECVSSALGAVRDSLLPSGAPHPSDFWGDGVRYALCRWPGASRRYSVSTGKGIQANPFLRDYIPPDHGPDDLPGPAADSYFVGCILARLLGVDLDRAPAPVVRLVHSLLAEQARARPDALSAIRETLASLLEAKNSNFPTPLAKGG